jgi:CubicO group peptidase (beta-lactamase class C family)
MSEPTRSFPDRPSLRYLRLEAKRRVSAGEFPALHEAQLAIAREHGLSSWTALKQFLESQPRPAGHAVEQLSWVISRFAGADRPAWVAPADEEMRQHFDDRFLSKIPPGNLVTTLARKAESFREELVVTFDGPLQARAQLSGSLQVHTSVEAEPPHRLTGLRFDRLGTEVTDTRTAAATTRTSGDVPASVAGVADEALSELGLVGLILAGGGPHTPVWAAARGWADLDRGEALETGHQFPAYSITMLVTSTAVLRLVADGRVGLDDPVNDHLRTVRLADDTVTVRELLTHTGGVDSAARKFADSVPALVSLFGPVIACGGDRGTVKPSNGGYAALGQLVGDATGEPYPDAMARLVLEPLGLGHSSFPVSWPAPDADAITGYHLAPDGSFVSLPGQVATVPAFGGLWTTTADLVRFGVAWSSLLPGALAREAFRPQATVARTGVRVGLGWYLNESRGVMGLAGGGPGRSASLVVRVGDQVTLAAFTNRLIPIEPVNGRVMAAIS